MNKVEKFKNLIKMIGAKNDLDANNSIIYFAIKSEERIDKLTKFIEENKINFNSLHNYNEDWKTAYINYSKIFCKILEMQGVPREEYKESLDVIDKYEKNN